MIKAHIITNSIEAAIEDQIRFGPSESAMVRIKQMLGDLREAMGPQVEMEEGEASEIE